MPISDNLRVFIVNDRVIRLPNATVIKEEDDKDSDCQYDQPRVVRVRREGPEIPHMRLDQFFQ